MHFKSSSQFTWVGWLILWPIFLWLAVLFAQIYRPDQTILEMAIVLFPRTCHSFH